MTLSGLPLVVLWIIFGWLVGGPLAVLATALPEGLTRTTGRRCPACRATLSPAALLLARSRAAERCRLCGSTAREAWPLVEGTTAAAFALLAARFDLGLPLLLYTLLAALLVLVLFIDVRHRLILDVVTFPAIAVAVPLAYFTVGLGRGLLGGLVAGGFFLAFYFLARLLYRSGGALGLGDVKLALLIGLVVGMPAALSTVFYTAIAGGVLAVGYLAAGRSRNAVMPYGPSLVVGALLTLLVDPSVWR